MTGQVHHRVDRGRVDDVDAAGHGRSAAPCKFLDDELSSVGITVHDHDRSAFGDESCRCDAADP